jgi:hypothetical protein
MKKPFTELERQELQEKIEAVPGGRFECPLPELFVGPKTGALVTSTLVAAQECPGQRFVEVAVLAVNKSLGMVHIMGKFRYN